MTIAKTGFSFLIAVSLFLALITPAFAQDRSTTTPRKIEARKEAKATTTPSKRLSDGKEKANREIDRRIESLNNLLRRVNAMERLSEAQKKTLAASIQAEIAFLTDLKAKITGETDIEKLREHLQSVKKSHRIYALIMPQAHILATAERVLRLADEMEKFQVKLETRIAEAKSRGEDASKMEEALKDFKENIALAELKAKAAIDKVVALRPDEGSESKLQENKKALKDARVDLRDAEKALRAARKNAEAIVKGIKSFLKEKKQHATTTATTTSGN